jgi:hypothetical protein
MNDKIAALPFIKENTMMKKNVLVIIIFLFCASISKGQQKDFLENVYQFIENPEVFELNQEPGHVPLVPYASVQEALKNNLSNSNGYLSLNRSCRSIVSLYRISQFT